MKKYIIIGIIVAIVSFCAGYYSQTIKKSVMVGSSNTDTYSGLSRATTTIDRTATTTALLSPGDVNGFCRMYNLSTSTVYLYATSTNSNTGVALGGGMPVNPITSSTNTYADLSGLRGYLYGIADGNGSLVSFTCAK